MIRFAALSETNYLDLRKIYPALLSTCIVNGRAPILPTEKYDLVRKEIASYKINNDTIVVLHVARCCEQKNQELAKDVVDDMNTDKGMRSITSTYESFGATKKDIKNYVKNELGIKHGQGQIAKAVIKNR